MLVLPPSLRCFLVMIFYLNPRLANFLQFNKKTPQVGGL
jgi:hypothetical protein